MPYLESLRKFLFRRRLSSFNSTNLHKAGEGHFNKIRSIGIVFDATDLDTRERVMLFAKRQKEGGSKVKLLGFFNKKLDDISFSFPYFSLKDINFFYIPKSDAVDEFIREPFDVLICLDLQVQDVILYISAASQAIFKIGPGQEHSRYFDLLVDLKPSEGLEGYIKTIKETFNKIT